MNVKFIKNCKNFNSTIQIDRNLTVKMTKDCYLVIDGCINTESFASASVRWRNFPFFSSITNETANFLGKIYDCKGSNDNAANQGERL